MLRAGKCWGVLGVVGLSWPLACSCSETRGSEVAVAAGGERGAEDSAGGSRSSRPLEEDRPSVALWEVAGLGGAYHGDSDGLFRLAYTLEPDWRFTEMVWQFALATDGRDWKLIFAGDDCSASVIPMPKPTGGRQLSLSTSTVTSCSESACDVFAIGPLTYDRHVEYGAVPETTLLATIERSDVVGSSNRYDLFCFWTETELHCEDSAPLVLPVHPTRILEADADEVRLAGHGYRWLESQNGGPTEWEGTSSGVYHGAIRGYCEAKWVYTDSYADTLQFFENGEFYHQPYGEECQLVGDLGVPIVEVTQRHCGIRGNYRIVTESELLSQCQCEFR